MRGMRVALFVAILATIVEISRAESTRQSLQCKNIARDVIINSCKGPRMKRSPEKFDTSNADQIVKATISGWISRSFFFFIYVSSGVLWILLVYKNLCVFNFNWYKCWKNRNINTLREIQLYPCNLMEKWGLKWGEDMFLVVENVR